MRVVSHWLFQSLLFYVLFIISYVILDDILTIKSNGLIVIYATLFYWSPMFIPIIISFYIRYMLSSLSRTISIFLLQCPALIYASYRLFNSPERYINKLIRNFPLEGDWLIYFTYLTFTILFSINLKRRGK
jgi:hypothetical protein